jgi:biotin carboxylase
MEKYCIVIDGFSTGKYFAPLISARGYQCIHIQSEHTIESVRTKTYQESNFSHHFKYSGNIDLLLNELNSFDVFCVIAGCESGVELASELSERLGTATNGIKMSEARRSKYLMHETLRKANVPSVTHIKTSSIDDLLSWAKSIGQFPVVLKPEKSSGGDCISFCNSEDEIRIGFSKIVDYQNIYGEINEFVLAQSYLSGPEYIVNTVSVDGIHYIAEIWLSNRKCLGVDGTIPVMQELLPPNGEIQQEVSKYIIEVLDALEVKHGAAHCEIVYTENGPILLEVGNRAHGLITPTSVSTATGTNHVELTIDAYIDPEVIKALSKVPYTKNLNMYHVFLSSNKDGILKSTPGLKKIEMLASCAYISISCTVGDYVSKSIDTCSTCGIVDLIHEDKKVLDRDYQLLRSIEQNELFEIE